MNTELLTIAANVVATPLLVLLTMWVKNSFTKEERQQKREDGFIEELRKRVDMLEKEVREVRVELKNRDAEYIELYKKYTTLKAAHEVLQVDHIKLTREYEELANEMAILKADIKTSAILTASDMQKL